MLIGITGGIGCGKSVVLQMLCANLEAPGYSSDDICRELMLRGKAGYREFVKKFGFEFLDESRNIDRQKLRDRIFADESSRKELEAILHPLVRQRIISEHIQVKKGTPVIAEVPLLFECGWEHDFDDIVCVIAPHELVIQRIIERDLITRDDALRIIGAQMSVNEKATRSDWVIENDADYSHVLTQATEIADLIRERCAENRKREKRSKSLTPS